MTQLVEQKHSVMHTIVSQILAKVKIVAITTDLATVMNATRSFIVMTIHYIGKHISYYYMQLF